MSKVIKTERKDIDTKFYDAVAVKIEKELPHLSFLSGTKAKAQIFLDIFKQEILEVNNQPNLFVKKNITKDELISLQKAIYILIYPLKHEQEKKELIRYCRLTVGMFLGVRALFKSSNNYLVNKNGELIKDNILFDQESDTNLIHFIFCAPKISADLIENSKLLHRKKDENITVLKFLYGKTVDKIEESQKDFFSNVVKNIISFFDKKITVFHSAIYNKNNEMLQIMADSIRLVVSECQKSQFIVELLSKNSANGYSPLTTACKVNNFEAIKIIFSLTGDLSLLNKKDDNGNTPLFLACSNNSFESIAAIFCLIKSAIENDVDGKNRKQILSLLDGMINAENANGESVKELMFDKIYPYLKEILNDDEFVKISKDEKYCFESEVSEEGDEGIMSPESSPKNAKKVGQKEELSGGRE